MAAVECFLYALCLAKHLEPMSRVGLATCHTVSVVKRTVKRVLIPTQKPHKVEKCQPSSRKAHLLANELK